MFINFSNHPSANWGTEQINEAEKYGRIVDLPFPAVSTALTKEVVYVTKNKNCGYKNNKNLCNVL